MNDTDDRIKTCLICKETKPLGEFPKNRQYADGHHGWCRPCKNARYRERYAAHTGVVRAGQFRRYLKWQYGLTFDQYEALVAKHGGLCGICKQPQQDPQKQRLCVDHDHQTGEVRGLLCSACNFGIGFFRDNIATLESALAYLKGGG